MDNGIVFLDPKTLGNMPTKSQKSFSKYPKIRKNGLKTHKSALFSQKNADFADFKTFITFDCVYEFFI